MDVSMNILCVADMHGSWKAYKDIKKKAKKADIIIMAGDFTIFEREIIRASIEKNTRFTDNHTPKNAFVFKVSSKGFLRYQVRLMMAALIDVGNGTYTVEDIKDSLINFSDDPMKHNAPSSGLNLHKVTF